MKSAGRFLFVLIGLVALALAVLGALLPVLPTTPFALLAAACFARSSPRLHAWLLTLPAIGVAIRDWERGRVIRTRTKVAATVISLALVVPAFVVFDYAVPVWARIVSASCLGIALTWVWLQRSVPIEPQP
ncbi:MAG: DUF454 family protein [Planctomycetes bacterium]|nr:DUF454 family protein [Planctomycetota bacterium]